MGFNNPKRHIDYEGHCSWGFQINFDHTWGSLARADISQHTSIFTFRLHRNMPAVAGMNIQLPSKKGGAGHRVPLGASVQNQAVSPQRSQGNEVLRLIFRPKRQSSTCTMRMTRLIY